MKMKMKKIGKMSSIFELSMSKLSYVEIFMKILGKKFHLIFKTLLTSQDKKSNHILNTSRHILNCKISCNIRNAGNLFTYSNLQSDISNILWDKIGHLTTT